MGDFELPDGFRNDLRAAWHRYIDLLAPLRPGLHGFCRRLTGNVWDAEDLVQDTLLRAFGTLGSVSVRIENPRAYLLRTATRSTRSAAAKAKRRPSPSRARAAPARRPP